MLSQHSEGSRGTQQEPESAQQEAEPAGVAARSCNCPLLPCAAATHAVCASGIACSGMLRQHSEGSRGTQQEPESAQQEAEPA
eukprot:2179018-Rhodomonas_salina.1